MIRCMKRSFAVLFAATVFALSLLAHDWLFDFGAVRALTELSPLDEREEEEDEVGEELEAAPVDVEGEAPSEPMRMPGRLRPPEFMTPNGDLAPGEVREDLATMFDVHDVEATLGFAKSNGLSLVLLDTATGRRWPIEIRRSGLPALGGPACDDAERFLILRARDESGTKLRYADWVDHLRSTVPELTEGDAVKVAIAIIGRRIDELVSAALRAHCNEAMVHVAAVRRVVVRPRRDGQLAIVSVAVN